MKKKIRVALVCMPWQDFRKGNIQIATLKSFAEKRLQEADIDVINFYLKIADFLGSHMYIKIMKSHSFFSESVYAKLMFPELELFTEYPEFDDIFSGENDFINFLTNLKKYQDKLFEEIDWFKYDIIGFTTSVNQLTSSLYMAKKIKEKYPDAKIIFGGTNSSGLMGKSLMGIFREIDIIVSGEGELNFYNILKSEIEGDEKYKKLPGIIYREGNKVIFNEGTNQLEDLNELEPPDYSDHFQDLEECKTLSKDFRWIPIEFSRGCFHNQCTFCNVKYFWKAYRMKKISKLIEEIKYLNKKHGVNGLFFCDSIFPEPKMKEIFNKLNSLNNELNNKIKVIELESKTSIDPKIFEILSKFEFVEMVLGIESFSSSLLKKMKKPSTLMYNVQALKLCELYNIFAVPNFIHNYPLNEKEEKEVLDNIELLKHLIPPLPNFLQVLIGSEIYNNPEKYGIEILGNEYNYKYIFPEKIRKKLNLQEKNYKIDDKIERRWKTILDKIDEWRREYQMLKKISKLPILYHIKKDDRIFVIRRTLNGETVYDLDKDESKLYEFCDTSKSLEEIKDKFENEIKNLKKTIKELKDKKLIFESDNRLLSLSIDLKKYLQVRYKNL